MSMYEAVIGLEVHVHLATASKLFCSCPNSFGDAPNTNVCEVCSGMPGVLPVLNRKAVEYASRMALAIHATINQRSRFARKNYFYPDMPKDYQISQFELPLCEHGYLDISVAGEKRRIGITRIHMEDDAGKNIHPQGENFSYVDLNRAGTPLIEIVSEPDLRSAEEAVAYLKKLHAMVVSLGISNGNMEEGCFRCDANVSIRPMGETRLGTRTELKNLNSFRNVQRAIEFEIARQTDLLDDGEKIVQETRLYDAGRNLTAPMRSKEDAQDYRYFPDPDLLPVVITDEELAAWAATQPELPEARMTRYMDEFHLPEQDAAQLCEDPVLADLFEEAARLCGQPRRVANIMLGMLMRQLNESGIETTALKLTAEPLAELATIIENGTISNKIAADIFPELMKGGIMPERLVRERGLVQVSDTGAIDAVVQKVLDAHPAEVAAYKGGKTKLVSFFVGQVMREMRGKANPAVVNEALARLLA
ncbi:Asp-tRNA(Asn)/Glu-tRNA(Gln) amidotransferase subunit GatB [uncultured Mailhella sp.]|uniref:Asp-tRNA(Asn)/Glu-tRNA(Gln) amidotransferase subunit GatB n=1 Tax=uncultured Mailhella sp. TaxID=1981031 RepID=UPI0026064C9A|nr:Asp-tRNA(Asn)/Glu-tRNA(Gln) amidotransferase subunit GatB [uncultured Mailhella sp.]